MRRKALLLLTLALLLFVTSLQMFAVNARLSDEGLAKHPPRTIRFYANNLQKEAVVSWQGTIQPGWDTFVEYAGRAKKSWPESWGKGEGSSLTIYLEMTDSSQLYCNEVISHMQPGPGYSLKSLQIRGNWVIAVWRYRPEDTWWWFAGLLAILSFLATLGGGIWTGVRWMMRTNGGSKEN